MARIEITELDQEQGLSLDDMAHIRGGWTSWNWLYTPIYGLGGYAGLLNQQWASTGRMWNSYNSNWMSNFMSGW